MQHFGRQMADLGMGIPTELRQISEQKVHIQWLLSFGRQFFGRDIDVFDILVGYIDQSFSGPRQEPDARGVVNQTREHTNIVLQVVPGFTHTDNQVEVGLDAVVEELVELLVMNAGVLRQSVLSDIVLLDFLPDLGKVFFGTEKIWDFPYGQNVVQVFHEGLLHDFVI